MKPIHIALIVVLVALQYLLWWGDGGILVLQNLKSNVQTVKLEQTKMRQQNYVLMERIDALKSDNNAIESLAREEHNMVQEGETYFQIIEH